MIYFSSIVWVTENAGGGGTGLAAQASWGVVDKSKCRNCGATWPAPGPSGNNNEPITIRAHSGYISQRHSGWGNILYCDGHVKPVIVPALLAPSAKNANMYLAFTSWGQ